jgi:hypothetical protein
METNIANIHGMYFLILPNALKSENWRNRPEVSHGLICYPGCPITLPNEEVFGATCARDTKENVTEAAIGKISEILDGETPHPPRGCIAQAWSVAEILRSSVEDVYKPYDSPGYLFDGQKEAHRADEKG